MLDEGPWMPKNAASLFYITKIVFKEKGFYFTLLKALSLPYVSTLTLGMISFLQQVWLDV